MESIRDYLLFVVMGIILIIVFSLTTILYFKKKSDGSRTSVYQFLKWMKSYVWLYTLTILLLVALQYFRTLLPLFIQYIINVIFESSDTATGLSELPKFMQNLFTPVSEGVLKALFSVALVYVIFALIRVIIIFTRRWLNGVFMESVSYKMRNTLYQTLQNLKFSYHTKSETGDLIQRCTTDVETYRVFVGEQLVEIFRLFFLIGFSIYQMLQMSPIMTLFSIMVTPVIFIITALYFSKVKSVFTVVEEKEGKMTSTLQESVSGIRVVKAFANGQYEIDKFEKDSREFLTEDLKLLKLMAFFWGGTDFLIFVQYASALIAGIILTNNGTLLAGDFTAYLIYIGMVVWPLRQLGRIIGDFGKTKVALDRLDDIVLEESEYVINGNEKPDIHGQIEFKNVSFQFEDDHKHLLNDISFKIDKGQTLAIIGKTGSGKSTLINLLTRLLEIQDGQVLIDGHDIKTIEKHHLRHNIGMIMQEPFLYSRSLYDNIGIMKDNPTKEEVHHAADIASIHNDIKDFELGYETMVGERGVTLSGGQKQRVAIARMLLDNKPVLIFDDSLSAVDTETDIQIRKALANFWSDTTVIIITHRITSAMEADQIIVLDQGTITQKGTHDELVQEDGLYKELWDIQADIQYDYDKMKEVTSNE
jgi:ATP-binding cassette subfamily B protein